MQMKPFILLAFTVLILGVSGCCEKKEHFQIATSKEGTFRIDTVTGETWEVDRNGFGYNVLTPMQTPK
jgi:hypothetical protein